MSSVIDSLERAQLRRVPSFSPGDRLKVHFQVIEGSRRRTQVFEGVVIKRQGAGVRETFTVRKQSFGVGVERTFPVHSPKIEKIDVAARGDVRRAKLYYLRGRVGKRARVRERRYLGPEEAIEPGLMEAPDAEAPVEGEGGAPEAADAPPVPEEPTAGEGAEGTEGAHVEEGGAEAPQAGEPGTDAPPDAAEAESQVDPQEVAAEADAPEGDAAADESGEAPDDEGGEAAADAPADDDGAETARE